ncbi:MAG: M13 family metallopeptidase [Oscillospiraceae bacterium]|nr:M13 family metallopeptidase [Oscillospiraceae bacterium]
MKDWKKRLAAGFSAAALALSLAPSALAADLLTRGEARDILMTAADDYAGLTGEELLKGDEAGDLHLDRLLTRAEALVMLERAFGGFEAPVGANARMAFAGQEFTDVPSWAESELSGLLASGIVDEVGEGGLSHDALVEKEDLETLIRRAYALKGTNLKDDFYAAVNKEWLTQSTIPAGQRMNGALYGLSFKVDDQIAELIADIAAKPQASGTAEAKISALYRTVMDMEGRNAAGAEPIRTYLDAIDNAQTVADLVKNEIALRTDLGLSTLTSFLYTTDLMDSEKTILFFGAFGAAQNKDFYLNGTQEQTEAYLQYMTTLFTLAGEEETAARATAQRVYDTEKSVAAASLDPQDQGNVSKIYNLYTMEELKDLFPEMDLDALFAATKLKAGGDILVTDVGALEAAAAFCTQEHLPELKAMSKQGLILSVADCLSQDFQEAGFAFNEAYYGVEGRQTTEQIAAQQVQSLLRDYLSRAYAETYFSPEAKADVEEMVGEFIAIYKERIQAQDWMSEETKQMALKKLDAMGVKVGYPDSWDTYLDDAEIKAPEEGGTFFSNTFAIQRAAMEDMLARQDQTVDKSVWITPAYTVNAFYLATNNDITFPAAILQAPMYDVNASREENLGAIGYVIAHEITHAFDNNGAKFDEKGNAADWWTEADYAAFQEKCQAVAEWYDGQESAPGITCSGELTLSENVADLGAAACVVEAAKRMLEEPDYKALFRSMANAWASTSYRSIQEYLAVADLHAPDKLRVNRVLQTIPEFYETFDIKEGDGMWVDPADRVSIW